MNDTSAGNGYQRPYQMSIKEYLHLGKNEIRVHVSNQLINRCLDPDREVGEYQGTVIEEWPYFTEILNKERRKRLSNRTEKEMIKSPLPSGLVGKAQICFYRTEQEKEEI